MILLPRTRSGWLALIAIVLLADAVGQQVSPQWGAFAFALAAVIVGSLAIVTFEAWRADVWRGTSPRRASIRRSPSTISCGASATADNGARLGPQRNKPLTTAAPPS